MLQNAHIPTPSSIRIPALLPQNASGIDAGNTWMLKKPDGVGNETVPNTSSSRISATAGSNNEYPVGNTNGVLLCLYVAMQMISIYENAQR